MAARPKSERKLSLRSFREGKSEHSLSSYGESKLGTVTNREADHI
jgi:hypothetical protein